MEQNEEKWLMEVKQERDPLGFNYVQNLTNIDNDVYNATKCDTSMQQCYSRIMIIPKGNLYTLAIWVKFT